MPDRDDLRWFKETFHADIAAATAGTPFSADLLTAVAAQETGHIWSALHDTLPVDEILSRCVGDTIDARPDGTGRRVFPRTKAELVAAPRGAEMFALAHDALVNMAKHVPGFAAVAKNPNKFCHAYGIFQMDLQFFPEEPDYFLEGRWRTFAATLGKAIDELEAASRRIKLNGKPTLTDLEQVHVAIAYNAGSFNPARGLKQGFKNSDGQFYGELVFDFLRLSQTIPLPDAPSPIAVPATGTAPIARPTPVTSTGDLFEVDVKDAPLRLRSTPKVDKKNPTANVIARLPDGQIVRHVSGDRDDDNFMEVETSLSGAHFQGFAASQFLVPFTGDLAAASAVTGGAVGTAMGGALGLGSLSFDLPAMSDAGGAADASGTTAANRTTTLPVIVPSASEPTTGIVAVRAPRTPGSITKRTAIAGAQSLNEENMPRRAGDTPEALRAAIAAILDYLAVDKASHLRYKPRTGLTFCNIYAHDYCDLANVYLPRVWWTQDAIERLAQGQTVEPRLGATIDEQRANDLFRWLRAFGPRFGWRQTSTLTKLQTEVNVGAVGLIVARRKEDGRSGHIVIIVPEIDDHSAKRDRDGNVTAPLQSQAGARNFRYGTGAMNWWQGEQFADSAFWIHA